MSEIIFHIGMNKCASTTLQEQIFKNEPGALGKFKGVEYSKDFAKQFQSLTPVGGRQFGNVQGFIPWMDKVKESKSKTYPNLDRFIVSSESLCQTNKFSDRPIIPFLKKINDDFLKDGTVKVMIIFRNQADMLASDYAQMSGVRYNSSQNDFEKSALKRINGSGKKLLDWGGWAQDLIDAFGKENVCILLLEDIKSLRFWDTLVDFISSENLSAQELHKKSYSNNKNRRSINDKTWKITPFSIHDKAKIDVNKLYHFIWSPNKLQSLRQPLFDYSIEMEKRVLKLMGYQNGKVVDSTIKLDENVRKQIQSYFFESNKILSDILERDLNELGYF